mmetsp:Transcript_35099/g.112140  ORF Transcript_35099/g.112140 Transcript_35099/m.112140 type:complete len:182 (-) Transcript_35099:157-702(-)
MLDGKSVPCAPRMPTCVEKGLRGVSHPSNAGARNTLDCPALPADTAPTKRQQRQPAAAPHMATGRLGGSWVPCRAARTGASKRPRSAPVARSGGGGEVLERRVQEILAPVLADWANDKIDTAELERRKAAAPEEAAAEALGRCDALESALKSTLRVYEAAVRRSEEAAEAAEAAEDEAGVG